MKKLHFVKLSGAGNDFILLKQRELALSGSSAQKLARRLCDRKNSIGADGLLIVRRSGSRHSIPSLEYYNADGSRAFCANGSRCAAWWMRQAGWARDRFSFLTIRGPLQAVVAGKERSRKHRRGQMPREMLSGQVRLEMPEAKNLRLNAKIAVAGRRWVGHCVNTGVPHVVIESKGLDSLDVLETGRAIRRHKMFSPSGTNVNFVRLHGDGIKGFHRPVIRVRTYERGVEEETSACGTGATAAAITMSVLKRLRPPVRILTRNGDWLTVFFRRDGNHFKDIWLEGPAKITFQGEVSI